MTSAFQRALCLHMIEATERGTGYRAFDPPPARPNYKAWLWLVVVPLVYVGGAVWGM